MDPIQWYILGSRPQLLRGLNTKTDFMAVSPFGIDVHMPPFRIGKPSSCNKKFSCTIVTSLVKNEFDYFQEPPRWLCIIQAYG